MWHQWQSGKPERPDTARRQSLRRTPIERISNATDDSNLRAGALWQGGGGIGAPPLSTPHRQSLSTLYQPARRAARRMHLLRLLREVRLRQLLQGEPADHDPPVPDDEG